MSQLEINGKPIVDLPSHLQAWVKGWFAATGVSGHDVLHAIIPIECFAQAVEGCRELTPRQVVANNLKPSPNTDAWGQPLPRGGVHMPGPMGAADGLPSDDPRSQPSLTSEDDAVRTQRQPMPPQQ